MFALCDQRHFYASCETVFRPDLRQWPIVVLSNNDGCIVAINEYASAIGVQKFSPYFKQKALIQQQGCAVFSSNYALYGEISKRIMQTLASEVPAFEIYSIDEGFCDLSGIPNKEQHRLACHIRHKIWKEQRIPAGVSIASTKTLAKLGQFATKKVASLQGVCMISNNTQRLWLLNRAPVSEVWGVGRNLAKKLNALQIHSAAQLAAMPEDRARQLAGVCLVRTVNELNGISTIALDDEPAPRQSIICSRSFGERLSDINDIKTAIANYAARVSQKLRAQGLYAGRIGVFLQTNRFEADAFCDAYHETIPGGSHDSRTLVTLACRLITLAYQNGRKYVKAGVTCTDLRPAETWQQDLFQPNHHRHHLQSDALMNTLDAIDNRFRTGTVKIARQAGSQPFRMNQDFLSPAYLSRWSDIPSIKA